MCCQSSGSSSTLSVDELVYRVVDSCPMSTTVRVSEETRRRAAALAKATGRQLQQVIEEAVTDYERELFWRQMAEGYEALAEDARSWADVQAERTAEAGSLGDDIRGDEPPR